MYKGNYFFSLNYVNIFGILNKLLSFNKACKRAHTTSNNTEQCILFFCAVQLLMGHWTEATKHGLK